MVARMHLNFPLSMSGTRENEALNGPSYPSIICPSPLKDWSQNYLHIETLSTEMPFTI